MGGLLVFEGYVDFLQCIGNLFVVLGVQQWGVGNIVVVNVQLVYGGSLNGEGGGNSVQCWVLFGNLIVCFGIQYFGCCIGSVGCWLVLVCFG